MKKLIIALGAVVMAAGVQAATFSWTTSAKAYGVDATTVVDNGNYASGTTAMKNNGTWNYVLTLYASGTESVVGSASGAASFGSTGKVSTSGIEIAAAAAGTTYDYVLTITGTQNSLTARGEEASYDYTAAQLATTLSGSITTANNGVTGLQTAAPSTWAISGITAVAPPPGPEPIPEPTSGLLMLLGVAGLALRRKQK